MPYIILYTYEPDLDRRARLREAALESHRSYLQRLVDEGTLLVAGPIDGDRAGGLLVVDADTEAGARDLVREDPFVVHGLVTHIEVCDWTPTLGAFAAPLTASHR